MALKTRTIEIGYMDRDLPLSARLMAVAEAFAFADDTAILVTDTRLAELLAGMAREVENEYVFVDKDPDHGWPTVAQGIALARFLRRTLEAETATVAMGFGLPANYIRVRFSSGYEGGIAPDGRTST